MRMVLRSAKLLAAASLTLVLASTEVLAGGGCMTNFTNFLQAEAPDSQTLSRGFCQTCHAEPVGGPNFNRYGEDMRLRGADGIGENCDQLPGVSLIDILLEINGFDSDGEGSTNAAELAAGTQPGWCDTNGCTNPVGTPPNVQLDPDVASEPPVADAGGPYFGVAGETPVVFDGSGSSDPENDPLEYLWDFGNGDTGTGVSPAYTYPLAGSYTVTLVVSDGPNESLPDTATAEITAPAVNVQPDADPGGPYTGEPGVEIVFDGSGSSDPNGDELLSYSWDFGDSATGSGISPSHTYSAPGEYTVSLIVNDGQLDSLAATTTATIAEASDSPPQDDSLYATYCIGCHGDPWDGPAVDDTLAGKRRVAGARSCNIEGSIFGTSVFPDGAPGMQSLRTLTSEDIQSLADYLNSEPTSGERRYVTTCAGCHGNNGEGGRVDEDVHGDSAHETFEAIREESEMRYLACMPEDDIHAVTTYLAGHDDDYDDDGIPDDEDEDDDNDGIHDDDDEDDDNDGVSDDDEYEDGTDPRDHDSDDDGLDDGEEKEHGTDPNDFDTDDDGESDGAEVHTFGTDPLVANDFDSQSRSGGGAPGVPTLLILLLVVLARRAVGRSD